ncbi:MAG: hypothetical protein KR126chlam3_01467 [Chlamydiae bacterium]|nr:hypothetical protein [Chlamydiota bacterium]
MKRFLVTLCLFSTQMFGFFPSTSVGDSEIIGNLQEGLLIPLAEFSYLGSKTEIGSPCLKYKSRIFPAADFVFVRDLFNHSFRLEEYADWFTQKDFVLFPHKERSIFYGGVDRTTPMLMQRWENRDCYYFQLFFGRGREGFCCNVYLPKPAYEDELFYWEDFFAKLPYLIDFIP